MMLAGIPLLVLAGFPGSVLCASYFLSDNLVGSQFLSAFTHQNIPDPTNGRVYVRYPFASIRLVHPLRSAVEWIIPIPLRPQLTLPIPFLFRNYVSQATALAKNLTYANRDTLILRADYTTVLDPRGPGRDSFRLQSNKQYTNHVVVWNIRHMPQGCSTWPAIWEVGDNWPTNGEIDILEGINDISPNRVTLHSTRGCTMPLLRNQTGTTLSTDCDVHGPTEGCGTKSSRASSFGPSFNAIGGGWYAMERTDTYIRVWHWQRNDTNIPTDVKYGSMFIDTAKWGTPFADFPNTNCNLSSYFGPQNIIINLTFCGGWAGREYGLSTCPGDCVDNVNRNPSSFKNAYFDIAWLKIYE